MKGNFLLDYLACILFKAFGVFFRLLPVGLSLFLGRRLGDCFYYLDVRHKARSYANIRSALGLELSPPEISKITRKFYQSFGQNIIEIFLIPKVDKAYMDKYVNVRGLENIYAALKKGKGAILIAVHAGSWELANIICANFGFPFYLFVKDQDFPRLSEVLNEYRRKKGCKVITKEGGLKQLIGALKENAAVGITLDQGGKTGDLVNFLGRTASMSTGGIKLALKYNSPVLPVYFRRIRGPKIEVLVGTDLELTKTADAEQDIKDNLKKITGIFEGLIRMYPEEYLWTYKIWKYSDERNILILSDGKAGHLSQSKALAGMIGELLKDRGIRLKVNVVQVIFKNRFARAALILSSALSGRYHCQGCLWCLRKFLLPDTYKALVSFRPDIVISCGSSLAAVNFIVSRESLARSVVIMRPSFLGMKRFDLVVMPFHDRPPKRKNVAAIKGSLNLITPRYLEEESARLAQSCNLDPLGNYIGLLIGGSSRRFVLGKDLMLAVIKEVKKAAEARSLGILLTTSRRTSAEVEDLIKKEFKDYPLSKLTVIANEKNIPGVVAGILGLSRLVVVSPESISMVSEAAAGAKPVVVFKAKGLIRKHLAFLENLAEDNHITLTEADTLSEKIEEAWDNKQLAAVLRDNEIVRQAVARIL